MKRKPKPAPKLVATFEALPTGRVLWKITRGKEEVLRDSAASMDAAVAMADAVIEKINKGEL